MHDYVVADQGTAQEALDKMIDTWRDEHPELGFTRLIDGLDADVVTLALAYDIDQIAGLQHGLLLARAPPADEAEMPAPALRHHLGDDAGLAVALDAEDDCLFLPLHGADGRERPLLTSGIRDPFRGSARGRCPSSRAP